MPAGLPGATLAENQANPSQGRSILFDPLSGPKASPFDAKTITGYTNGVPDKTADILNISTGGLCTGIGFGSPPIFGPGAGSAPLKFNGGNFTDDYVPGQDLPSSSAIVGSALQYIGGGRTALVNGTGANGNGTPAGTLYPSVLVYAVGMVGLCMAGNGGNRDGGTTPFTGFPVKTVTAVTDITNGGVIEAGFVNRSGVTVLTGQSAFGSSTTPLTDVT